MHAQLAPAIYPEEVSYRDRTKASYAYFLEGQHYLPGADSRSPLFYQPYPIVLVEGQGCWLVDLDGNRLLDFTSNHTSLVLGYGHSQVVEAVQRQLAQGTCFPGASEPQARLGRLLCDRMASVELVRFTNSGTEAAMYAVRAARAFTGCHMIAKIEGGYNGSADSLMVSTHPSATQVSELSRPAAIPSSLGLPPETLAHVMVLPFNEIDATARLIEQAQEPLAAVIVEPLLGSAGMIPAEPDYLAMLREITNRLGILLIFDEVVSFRVAYGGAEEHYGIVPDLTCLGKLIGGGFPLGAFGGRREIMTLFDPSHGRPPIPHPGSYNANPVSLVAGATALEVLTRNAVTQLNRMGEFLRDQMRATFAQAGVPVQVTGLGSLFGMHLTPHPVKGYRDTLHASNELRHRLFLGLFNEGIMIDPRGVGCVSLATRDNEIVQFIETLRRVLYTLRGS